MQSINYDLFENDKQAIKVLVISDSHGDINLVLKVIEYHLSEIDVVLFLGDGADDIAEAAMIFPTLTYYGVRGNNDFSLPRSSQVSFPLERVVSILGTSIYMTHGHLAPYRAIEPWLIARAESQDADISLYGHLHIPACDIKGDLMLMNPGSLRYPRGGSVRSYVMLDVTMNGFESRFFCADSHEEISNGYK